MSNQEISLSTAENGFPLPLRLEGNDRDFEEAGISLARCSQEEARKLLPYEVAVRLQVLPLRLVDDALLVLVSEDAEAVALQELRFRVGRPIIADRATAAQVSGALSLAYCDCEEGFAEAIDQADEATIEARVVENFDSTAAIPQLLEAIMQRAIARQSSDIHLEPDQKGYSLRFRIDGLLQLQQEFSVKREVGQQLVRRMKVLASLDTTVTQRPQDGGFLFAAHDLRYRLRVSFVPQIHGEKAVLRLFANNAQGADEPAISFQKLGLSEDQTGMLLSRLGLQSGAILLCGPTGSGKSTLLYAMLNKLNESWRNITTLEDPVERFLPRVNQIQVSTLQGMTYADFLPAVLRQDPDVLMIGEIRQAQVAELVLHAATTGHLVLSTVHAGSCPEALVRLRHLGISATLLSAALKLLVAQRLVPKNCPRCVKHDHPTEAIRSFFQIPHDAPIRRSEGCSWCRQAMVDGRTAVFEFLPISNEIREYLLHNSSDDEEFQRIARTAGYRPLATSVRDLLLAGEISVLTAMRTLGIFPEIFGYEEKKFSQEKA